MSYPEAYRKTGVSGKGAQQVLTMCNEDLETFARTYALSPRTARSLQCTAEHLQAKCDGGADSLENIVAACRLCNLKAFRRRIRRRLSRGRCTSRGFSEVR